MKIFSLVLLIAAALSAFIAPFYDLAALKGANIV
jgi:hypothetical protein